MKEIFKHVINFLTNRLFIMAVVFVVLFYMLIIRLFDLQIIQGASLNEAFSLRVIRTREIEGQRGGIYDRNGYPLAENVLAYTVQLDGSIYVEDKNAMMLALYNIIESEGDMVIKGFPIGFDIDHNFEYQQSSLEIAEFKRQIFNNGESKPLTDEQANMTVEEIFYYVRDEIFEIPAITYENPEDPDSSKSGYTDEEVMKILNIKYPLWLTRYSQYQLSTVALNISERTLARILENSYMFPGVTIVEDPLRQYNDAEYFAHIIGYTREINSEQLSEMSEYGYERNDIVGVTGIEKVMELELRGIDGVETVEVDNLGRTMDSLTVEDPQVGNDVFLTIDKDLQIASQDILEAQIANIIQSYLVYDKEEDSLDILMKDVFINLTAQDILSILDIEQSPYNTAGYNIYLKYIDDYNHAKRTIYNLTNLNNTEDLNENIIYVEYILDLLVSDDYLLSNYRELSDYDAYMKQDISFSEMITRFINGRYLIMHESDETDNPATYIIDRINDDYTNYYAFKKIIFSQMLDEEVFDYKDLAMVLQENNISQFNQETYQNLQSGTLDPLDYMKQIILDIEITPAELALDPSSGSVVVVDVNTGEVLSMVSYPSYDNNYLVNNFDYSYYLSLLNDPTSPLFPRATHAMTAPGSTFKVVSALTGLNSGVITVDDTITCYGLFDKIVPSAQCWIYDVGGTHGPIDVTHAIEVSCNYFFYEVGYRLSFDADGNYDTTLGLEALNETAALFGLGSQTGLELPNLTSPLSTVDPSRTAIGQAENNYTPVQMARYIATFANGGTLYELNIVDKVISPENLLIMDTEPVVTMDTHFDESYMDAVMAGMLAVTQGRSGSARNYFNGFPIDVAGKTGTAQESKTRPNHSFFVSFAPYDNPEIAVIATVPFGYGSSKAIPIARDVIASYYEIYEDRQPYSTDFLLDD